MPDNIPNKIKCAGGNIIPVVQKHLGGKLGYYNTHGEIGLEVDQPKAGKHLILLHEMIHAVAERLKELGDIKRQPDEKFITRCSGTLFPMLVRSGLWNGVTEQELEEFLKGLS